MELLEWERRRPEFTEAAVWITLADGSQWAFPKPWVEVRSRFNGGVAGIGAARTTHGPEFDAAIDALRAAETNRDLIIGVMVIGAHLLRKNYDLDDAELEELFIFRFADESLEAESLAMVQAIINVATGQGEASFRDGSDSP